MITPLARKSEQFRSGKPLPVIPIALPELVQTLGDKDINQTKLAKIISRFPSITARLLFLANSAWASPRVPITTLQMACVRLGLNLVRNVSIALAVSSPFDPRRCPSFNPEQFWCTALLVADAGNWLSLSSGATTESDPQVVYTAGLLHNLGLLWLADNNPVPTGQALEAAAVDESLSVKQALNQLCDMDYCVAGGLFGRAWSLPDVLVIAMEQHCNVDYQGEMQETAAIVGVATTMVSALYKNLEQAPDDRRLALLDITPGDRDAVYAKLAAKMEDRQNLARSLIAIKN